MGNYENRGSYSNGNYGNQRGNYRNSKGNYGNRSNGQNEQQNERKFSAKFRIRGIVCTDKQTGNGFTKINTRSGASMCSVNLMISKHQKTGDIDRDGNPVWKENNEFFRLIAFGKEADEVMGIVKPRSIMDFTGEIRMQKSENGFDSPSFVIEKADMVREFSGSNSNQNNGNGYQRTNGQARNDYQRNTGVYSSYEDRPANSFQRNSREDSHGGNSQEEQQSVQSDNCAEQNDENYIPF